MEVKDIRVYQAEVEFINKRISIIANLYHSDGVLDYGHYTELLAILEQQKESTDNFVKHILNERTSAEKQLDKPNAFNIDSKLNRSKNET